MADDEPFDYEGDTILTDYMESEVKEEVQRRRGKDLPTEAGVHLEIVFLGSDLDDNILVGDVRAFMSGNVDISDIAPDSYRLEDDLLCLREPGMETVHLALAELRNYVGSRRVLSTKILFSCHGEEDGRIMLRAGPEGWDNVGDVLRPFFEGLGPGEIGVHLNCCYADSATLAAASVYNQVNPHAPLIPELLFQFAADNFLSDADIASMRTRFPSSAKINELLDVHAEARERSEAYIAPIHRTPGCIMTGDGNCVEYGAADYEIDVVCGSSGDEASSLHLTAASTSVDAVEMGSGVVSRAARIDFGDDENDVLTSLEESLKQATNNLKGNLRQDANTSDHHPTVRYYPYGIGEIPVVTPDALLTRANRLCDVGDDKIDAIRRGLSTLNPTVHLVDVGCGDCAILSVPVHHPEGTNWVNIMVDSGQYVNHTKRWWPLVRALGKSVLVMTHADRDHVGGFQLALKEPTTLMPCFAGLLMTENMNLEKEVADTEVVQRRSWRQLKSVKQAFEKGGLPVYSVGRGTRAHLAGGRVQIHFINPTAKMLKEVNVDRERIEKKKKKARKNRGITWENVGSAAFLVVWTPDPAPTTSGESGSLSAASNGGESGSAAGSVDEGSEWSGAESGIKAGLLFTADAHANDIVAGLNECDAAQDFRDTAIEGNPYVFDYCDVPHHGSDNNAAGDYLWDNPPAVLAKVWGYSTGYDKNYASTMMKGHALIQLVDAHNRAGVDSVVCLTLPKFDDYAYENEEFHWVETATTSAASPVDDPTPGTYAWDEGGMTFGCVEVKPNAGNHDYHAIQVPTRPAGSSGSVDTADIQ